MQVKYMTKIHSLLSTMAIGYCPFGAPEMTDTYDQPFKRTSCPARAQSCPLVNQQVESPRII